jgi:hypothetical protein
MKGEVLKTIIPAFKQINAKLVIAGDGNFMKQAMELVKAHQLTEKIIFTGKLPPNELFHYTANAWIGLTIFENNGLSNYYSLANRFFDYIQACIPQLCVEYPAYIELNKMFHIAVLIKELDSDTIAQKLNELLTDESLYYELQKKLYESKAGIELAAGGKKVDGFLLQSISFLSRHLHIVCLDAPYPLDYGGAVDMYGKIRALHKAGINIHLHYFDHKKRGNAEELARYCETVDVYDRKLGRKGFSYTIPYIVFIENSSRVSFKPK